MSRLRSLSRVMHISFGMPLISAEHEPHLPALQFHRTREIGRLLSLDAVHGIQDHHALLHRRDVILEAAAGRVSAPDSKHRLRRPSYFISSITAFNSSGIGWKRPLLHDHLAIRAAVDDDVVLAPFRIFARESPRETARPGSLCAAARRA